MRESFHKFHKWQKNEYGEKRPQIEPICGFC